MQKLSSLLLIASLVAAGCSTDGPPGRGRRGALPPVPTMAGTETFGDGNVLVEARIGSAIRPLMPRQTSSSDESGLPHGPGTRAMDVTSGAVERGNRVGTTGVSGTYDGMSGGYDTGMGEMGAGGGMGGMGGRRGMGAHGGPQGGGGYDEDGPRRGRGMGGPGGGMPRVAIQIRATNKGNEPVEIVWVECSSALGNFVVTPDKMTLEPGQSADSGRMNSLLEISGEDLPLTLTLKCKGATQKKTITMKQIASEPPGAQPPPGPPPAP